MQIFDTFMTPYDVRTLHCTVYTYRVHLKCTFTVYTTVGGSGSDPDALKISYRIKMSHFLENR